MTTREQYMIMGHSYKKLGRPRKYCVHKTKIRRLKELGYNRCPFCGEMIG